MTVTAGLDVGSTYTKAVIAGEDGEILGKAMTPTGFRLREVSRDNYQQALEGAGMREDDVSYVIATGSGRHQVDFKDLHVTDLTASARGVRSLFPGTRTILDFLGHKDVRTTLIYTHVFNKGGHGVRSPVDRP